MFSRLIAFVASLASLVILALTFWPQALGWQRTEPWSVLVSPRGAAAVLALVICVVFLALGRFGRPLRRILMAVSAWLLVFAVATGWLLNDRGFGRAFPVAQPDSIRVLSWNTMGDAPAPEMVAQMILESRADVVALPETTAQGAGQIARLLREDGQEMQVLTVAFDTVYRAHSTSLLIAERLGAYSVDDSAPQTSVSPTLVARSMTNGPTLVAAHVVAPSALTMGRWRDDLDILARLCSDDDVILAGDLNATVDNLQGLGRANLGTCVDAALATQGAAVGTWPSWVPALLGAPIDHVLASPPWRATGSRILVEADGSGSDHRPVLAQLQRNDAVR